MLTAETSTHIYRDEAGVAYVDQTRHKVLQIACDHVAQGWSAQEIVGQYPDLSLSQVHAALAYYYDHREEIDQQIAMREQKADAIRAESGDGALAARLRAAKENRSV